MLHFWEEFNLYVGVQGILALMVTIAIIVMVTTGRPVPGELWGITGVAWGFYFGKNGKMIISSTKEVKKEEEV